MSDLHIRHAAELEPGRRASPVGKIGLETQRLIDRMLELMRAEGHTALSAPQVGVDARIITVDLSGRGDNPVVLVDPVVESVSLERHTDREGCLSLPGVTTRVSRSTHISVSGRARTGHAIRIDAGGILARILQHHIDHLNGVLILEQLAPTKRPTAEIRLGIAKVAGES
ncbi:MAG: peptide deformylase [Gemmatimonadota bacterium]